MYFSTRKARSPARRSPQICFSHDFAESRSKFVDTLVESRNINPGTTMQQFRRRPHQQSISVKPHTQQHISIYQHLKTETLNIGTSPKITSMALIGYKGLAFSTGPSILHVPSRQLFPGSGQASRIGKASTAEYGDPSWKGYSACTPHLCLASNTTFQDPHLNVQLCKATKKSLLIIFIILSFDISLCET
jgi:hypothetical protein